MAKAADAVITINYGEKRGGIIAGMQWTSLRKEPALVMAQSGNATRRFF